MRPTLCTARMELRPMSAGSDELLVEHADHEVVEAWLPRAADPDRDALGMGAWMAYRRRAFVGWFCLTPRGPAAADLAYRLRRSSWGHGLATEGAGALVEHAFTDVGLVRVFAQTMAANAGSRSVLEKLGMRRVRTEVRSGVGPVPGARFEEVVFELTAAQWRAARATDPGSRLTGIRRRPGRAGSPWPETH